jgi:single-strand DNA-binding protein
MASLNKTFLIGNLTRDPEVRYTPKGTPLAELGLAINRTWTEDGQKREETTFVDVTLWGRTAEIAQQYLKKGSPAFIEGRLQMDSWEDRQSGQKRSRLRVVCERLQLLGDGRSRESTPAPPPRPSEAARASQPTRPAGVREPDPDVGPEDIPFHARIYRDVKQCRLNRRVF